MSKNIDRRLERLEVELAPEEDDVLRIEVECIGQPELNTVTEVRYGLAPTATTRKK